MVEQAGPSFCYDHGVGGMRMDEQILAVQRMQDYIEAHLGEEITMADLSRAALFSPWYAYRLFRAIVGLSPADYIRKLRLSRSALRLRDESCRISDVALEAGFGSMDGYTRAFYREFGCNPSQYAHNPVPLGLFIPYGVKYRAIEKGVIDMENVHSVFVQAVRRPRRRCVIRRAVNAQEYFSYCEEVGCDVWGVLTSMKSICGEPVCLWLPDAYRKPHTSRYVQGVERAPDDDAPIPEGFDTIELPETEYLAFQGEPFAEEDYETAILAVQRAMERYDPAAIGYAWDDSQPRIQLEPRGERGYIELRPVRRG